MENKALEQEHLDAILNSPKFSRKAANKCAAITLERMAEFAEWLAIEQWYFNKGEGWVHINDVISDKCASEWKRITTEELINLYLESLNK